MSNHINVSISSKCSIEYQILINPDTKLNIISWLIKNKYKKIIIIADDITANLYANDFCNFLLEAAFVAEVLSFPNGEKNKTLNIKLMLEQGMFDFGCDRFTLCVAFGGGVVGDVSGFVAATYMRGINYIQIPTTLLAMIDSSVGGKTGINCSYGKNIIGAYWHPKLVVMNTFLLKTLPKKHIISGLIEAIKIFLTCDRLNYNYVLDHLEEALALRDDVLVKIIRVAVQHKVDVVTLDPYDQNLRHILNFGHTIGHALEKILNYKILHGYAVGLGIIFESKISQILGYISAEDFLSIFSLFEKLEINRRMFNNINCDDLIKAMLGDKKTVDNSIMMVLIKNIGAVENFHNQVLFSVTVETIKCAFLELMGGDK